MRKSTSYRQGRSHTAGRLSCAPETDQGSTVDVQTELQVAAGLPCSSNPAQRPASPVSTPSSTLSFGSLPLQAPSPSRTLHKQQNSTFITQTAVENGEGLPSRSNSVHTVADCAATRSPSFRLPLSPVLEQLPSKFHRTLEESSEISSWATNSSFLPVSSDNSPASSPKATRTLQLRSRDIQVTSRDAQASQQRRIPIASAQRGPTIHLDVNVQYGGPTASQDSEEEEQEEVEDRDDLDTRVPPETRACAELYFERLNTAQAPNNLDIEDSTSQSISTSYRQLAQLPTVFKPLPTHALRHFGHACERMASVYLAEPSDLALFDILALPKVGLAPALSSKTPAAVRTVLDAYPAVPWPEI